MNTRVGAQKSVDNVHSQAESSDNWHKRDYYTTAIFKFCATVSNTISSPYFYDKKRKCAAVVNSYSSWGKWDWNFKAKGLYTVCFGIASRIQTIQFTFITF